MRGRAYRRLLADQRLPAEVRGTIAQVAVRQDDPRSAGARMAASHSAVLAFDWIPVQIRRTIALEAMRSEDYESSARMLLAKWHRGELTAGLEESPVRALTQLARAAQGRPGVLVIEAGAVGGLDWLEGLLTQPGFAQRVVLFGSGSFEAVELAARHPGQVRRLETDEVADLIIELLSMPWSRVSQVSYLGRADRFEVLKRGIAPWGLGVHLLEPGVKLRLILSALGVPSETLNQVDTDRLQEQLARERAA